MAELDDDDETKPPRLASDTNAEASESGRFARGAEVLYEGSLSGPTTQKGSSVLLLTVRGWLLFQVLPSRRQKGPAPSADAEEGKTMSKRKKRKLAPGSHPCPATSWQKHRTSGTTSTVDVITVMIVISTTTVVIIMNVIIVVVITVVFIITSNIMIVIIIVMAIIVTSLLP